LGSLSKAVFEGDVENGSVMAGQITGMVRDIRPAKEIIETLFKDAEAIAGSLKIAY
jgi:NAD(P)H-dependent flavin oxidoreductase YrpB (nitropropane dioxygenase family)